MAHGNRTRILPPGFDEKRFDQALDELVGIVGLEHVSRDHTQGAVEGPNGETGYADYWAMPSGNRTTPSGAIRPASVEEIQAVLKIANHYRLPLWTVSRGRNFGYGGSGTVVGGTVILDLHRMNKIIEVNETLAYAIVEPGVTFFDLYNYIQERGYRLWPSVPALSWGSVIGNTLERGFGYTPAGDHSQQQCGMEVVLPSGEVVRTGMGALPDSPMWALYKGGFGPGVDGLFYQSNLGIVTKLGIHIMPSPACLLDCSVSVPAESQLACLVGVCASLEREGIIQNHASIANPYRQALFSKDDELRMHALNLGVGGGGGTTADLTVLMQERGLGYWVAKFAVYGASPAVADANWKLVQERFSVVPGAIITADRHVNADGSRLDASKLPALEVPYSGYPTVAAAELMNARGPGGGHVDIAPLFPADGLALQEWWLSEARDIVAEAGFDTFADFHVYGRYIIAILLIVYAPHEAGRVEKVVEQLLASAKKAHVSEYRAHVNFMDRVRSDYDFNDMALTKFIEQIKNMLDPAGVLSQGKQGIWAKGRSDIALHS